jgi:hypothetical protein
VSTDDASETTGYTTLTRSVDWKDRTTGRAKRMLLFLERLTLRAERPVEAVVGRSQFNPLHWTGPISVFLFIVVFATGLYLTMFYRFGFEASYASVRDVEASLAGRFVRAGHRYGSVALVVTALLHGWRTFVMDRFRGPRRIAWLTGVAMVALVWIIGVTGYWLIWDERVEVLNDALTGALRSSSAGLDFLLDFVLTDAAGTGWPFLLLLFFVHVGISIGVAVLIWIHVKRLARPLWLPPPSGRLRWADRSSSCHWCGRSACWRRPIGRRSPSPFRLILSSCFSCRAASRGTPACCGVVLCSSPSQPCSCHAPPSGSGH